MSSSQQWAGLSKPQSSRKSSGRHRGQKLPGTPFFQVDPVVSLDRLDHPKPKVTRRRSRKAAASSKENRPAANSSLSVGVEFSTASADGEKLSTDPPRTGSTATTFGESSSVTYASDDQTTEQFLANAGLRGQHAADADDDDPAIGQTITYASDEDAAAAADTTAAVDNDDFRAGLSLSYSSTLNCGGDDLRPVTDTVAASSSSYLEFDSSLCQYSRPAPFVDVPIPEKHPAAPSPQANKDLIQPLLTAAANDHDHDHDTVDDDRDGRRRRTGPGGGGGEAPRSGGFWSCFTCCIPPRSSLSRLSRFII